MSALDTTSIQQVLDDAIAGIRSRVDLTQDETDIIRRSVHRATELGLGYHTATVEQRVQIEHEIKALRATVLTITEKKAVDALQTVQNTLNGLVTRGVDMLLDRVLGPDTK